MKKGLSGVINRVYVLIRDQLFGIMIFDIVIKVWVRESFWESDFGGI